MVSRREKLKLSQSKAQEQIFNLHVKLINQELSAGNLVSFYLFIIYLFIYLFLGGGGLKL